MTSTHRLLERTSVPYLQRLGVLPLAERGGRLQVAAAAPLDGPVREELARIFSLPVDLNYAPRAAIARVLETLEAAIRHARRPLARSTKLEYGVAEASDRSDASGRETVRAVDDLLLEAIRIGASDLHIQPTAQRASRPGSRRWAHATADRAVEADGSPA